MTYKLTITPPLKKWCASIAIIFTALVLVGCATNKSSGAISINSTSGTVDNSLPPISELTLDASLNDIPPQIRTAANSFFSFPIQASDSTGNRGVISQSSSNDPDSGDSIETLIAEVTESVNNRPVYRIAYQNFNPNEHNAPVSQFTITSTTLPLSNVQHVTPPLRNGMNLKLTAIDYDLIGGAGDTTIDGNFYLEIYTNYGETSGDTTFDNENYLAMGTWLFRPADRTDTANYSVGSFVNGADVLSDIEEQSVTGTVSYTGAAYGFALLYNDGGTDTEALPLSADVNITVVFGGNTDGTINNFNIRSGTASSITSVSGQINLGRRSGGSTNAELVFTTSSGDTRTHDYTTLFWTHDYYGHNEGGQPDRVAGTVMGLSQDSTDDTAESSLLNFSFGAYKDPK